MGFGEDFLELFSSWFFFLCLRHANKSITSKSKAKIISAVSATVYRLVEGIAHVAVSVTGSLMITAWDAPEPVYEPAPVPFQARNARRLPVLSVAVVFTLKFAAEPELYHPLPVVMPYAEVTLR